VEDINAGKLFPMTKLDMATEDTQGNSRVGIQAFNKEASSNIPLIVSGFSAVIYGQAPLAVRNKIVLLSVGANDPKVATLGDYVVTTTPLADIDLTALANYVYKDMSKRKLAVLYVNDASGKYGAQVMEQVFKAAGGSVVESKAHETSATNFTPQLTALRNAQPDVVHIQSNASQTPLIIKQARDLGIKAQLTTYSVGDTPEVAKLPAADGMLVTTFISPQRKEVVDFKDRLTKKLGRVPNGFSFCCYLYDALYIVGKLAAEANARSAQWTGSDILDSIFQIKSFDTPVSGTTVINKNHTVVKPVTILKATNGAFQQVQVLDPGSEYLPI
jgi:branched-chain amino acid transport system substrate-binding protein